MGNSSYPRSSYWGSTVLLISRKTQLTAAIINSPTRNSYINQTINTYLTFSWSGCSFFPPSPLIFSRKQGSQYPTHRPAAHFSVFSSSSNVEHLLQIGIVHFKQVYFVFEKQELHISSLVMLALHAAISVDKYAPQRMLPELNCLQNTLQ